MKSPSMRTTSSSEYSMCLDRIPIMAPLYGKGVGWDFSWPELSLHPGPVRIGTLALGKKSSRHQTTPTSHEHSVRNRVEEPRMETARAASSQVNGTLDGA